MNTKLKEAAKNPENTEQHHRKGKFTSEDVVKAIKEVLEETKERIDVKFLWKDCGVHRFRVNFWDDVSIQRSEFVRVIEENGKLTVRRSNDKQ